MSLPVATRLAPGPLSDDVSMALCTTGGGSRQLHLSEGRLACAGVVVGRANSLQPSGPPKPTANASGLAEPAASSEAAYRRKSAEDMPGPLDGMPTDTTSANNNVADTSKQINKTPIFVSGGH